MCIVSPFSIYLHSSPVRQVSLRVTYPRSISLVAQQGFKFLSPSSQPLTTISTIALHSKWIPYAYIFSQHISVHGELLIVYPVGQYLLSTKSAWKIEPKGLKQSTIANSSPYQSKTPPACSKVVPVSSRKNQIMYPLTACIPTLAALMPFGGKQEWKGVRKREIVNTFRNQDLVPFPY